MAGNDRQEESHPPAGSRAHVLSVSSLGTLIAFLGLVGVLLAADVAYLVHQGMGWPDVWELVTSPEVRGAIGLSLLTSGITLALVVVFAVPVGYALSRYRFRGHSVLNAIVDVPIVLPPVVIGLSLLAFFGTDLGRDVRDALARADVSLVGVFGIVLCQFFVSISYAIRSMKASFDSVDRSLERVAMTLGCSPIGAFSRVTMPLARNGLWAGLIMAWARAIGVFGPLMIFVGTAPRVQVMPTMMWLQLSIGNIEVALTVALVSVSMATAALATVHWLAPGRNWT